MAGPDLLQNLIFVLLRLRQHKYAVSADIEGMFLQVGVREEGQPSLRSLKLGRDLISLLKLGGFHLTNIVSNMPDVTTALNPDNRESNFSVKDICTSPDQSSHVLGLKWDHVKDTLVVSRVVDCPLDKAITQRTVLSFLSSVFDPIGLVAPYTVKARLLLKDI